MMHSSCPTRSTLSQFASGMLSDEEIDQIAQHLEICAKCQAGLTAVDSDELMQALSSPSETDAFTDESACLGVVAQLAASSRIAFQAEPSSALLINPSKLDSGSSSGGSGIEDRVDAANAPAPPRLGQYLILRQIGRGGMGTVYQALHTHLERIVAVKVLASDRMQDKDSVARFEREMRAVGRLEHPHIVRAMDAGQHEGIHYLVMEYVYGPDLSAVVNRVGRLSVADACEVARQAALGLDYASRRGLVHRDIKPSNLMISLGEFAAGHEQSASGPSGSPKPHVSTEGDTEIGELTQDHSKHGGSSDFGVPAFPEAAVVRILDFGLALLEDTRRPVKPDNSARPPDGELTGSGQLMGTLDYIAPEQIGNSHDVDVRADIYSLGATLFKLLTGVAPFASEANTNAVRRIDAICTDEARLASSVRPDLPADVVAIVARLLARQPESRFQTPAEVASALAPWTAGADLKLLALTARKPVPSVAGVRSRYPTHVTWADYKLQNDATQQLEPAGVASEATTDRLRHDETGANLNPAKQTRDLDVSSTAKTPSCDGSRRRAASRWVVVLCLLLAALGIWKWRVNEQDQSNSLLSEHPKVTPSPSSAPEPLVVPFDANTAQSAQQAWADSLGVPAEFENSIGMKFRVIPPGRFVMGLTPNEVKQANPDNGFGRDLLDSSAHQRNVTLTKPFAVGVTEVTVDQYARFVDATDHETQIHGQQVNAWNQLRGTHNSPPIPIAHITWHDAVAMADWLSRQEKATYSLPSEAEWEFACRAGIAEVDPAGADSLDHAAWVNLSSAAPQPVGLKRPNAFGLFDMLGNVGEWCQDHFLLGIGTEPAIDPTGPPLSDNRVRRGGSLHTNEVMLRPGMRDGIVPHMIAADLGFRLVRRFDDSQSSRRLFLRPARPASTPVDPLGDNAIDVGSFGTVNVPSLKLSRDAPITIEAYVMPAWTQFRGTRHVVGVPQQCSLFVTPDMHQSGWSLGLQHDERFQGLMGCEQLVSRRRVHLAGVRTGQAARLFVDGKLVMQEKENSSPLFDSTSPFAIGGLESTIDEVRVSTVERYQADFTPQTRFEPDEHTLGLWHFDEGIGRRAADSSGHNHYGRLQGAKWSRPISGAERASQLSRASLLSDRVYLDDLEESEFVGYPHFNTHGRDHTHSQIIWRGQRPEHSVMVHPESETGGHVSYPINGQFEWFEATAAITENPGYQPDVPLTFRVVGDDKVLWTSRALNQKGDGDSCAVSVRGVTLLRLEVLCPGRNFGAHAFWMDPVLSTSQPEIAGLKFDGHDDYVEIPTLKRDDSGPYTVEMLLCMDRPKGVVISIDGLAALQMESGSKDGPLLKGLERGTQSSQLFARDEPMELGKWYHVAWVLEQHESNIFIDGRHAGSAPRVPAADARPHPDDVRSNTLIGSQRFNMTFDQLGMVGRVSEVRISNVARYARDFRPATRYEPDANTVALYHCNEGQGDHLADASGNKHHGRIVGATWITPQRRISSKDGSVNNPLSIAVNLGAEFNSTITDGCPSVSADGLTLVMHRNRGPEGRYDLFLSTRRAIDEPFSTPVSLGVTVNAADVDSGPGLSHDGNTLLFGSERAGGLGRLDLWMSQRDPIDRSFGQPVYLGAEVNSIGEEARPALSADGLTLIFESNRGGGLGGFDLWSSTRNSTEMPFGPATNLGPQVNSGSYEMHPSLSTDGCTLYFASDRGGGFGMYDLWKSTRRTPSEPFDPPTNLGPSINSPHADASPTVSDDGTLYFESNRPGGFGDYDVYSARLE